MSTTSGPKPRESVSYPEATTDGASGDLPAFLLEQLRGFRSCLTLRMPHERPRLCQPTVPEEQGNERRVA